MRPSILIAVFVLAAAPAAYAQPPAPLTAQPPPPPSENATEQTEPQPTLPTPPQPQTSPPPATQRIFNTPADARMRLRSVFGQARDGGVRERLVRAPAMFGDFYRMAPTLNADVNVFTNSVTGVNRLQTDFLSGDWSGLKVAENNSAMPLDRVFFNYNHHHNALTTLTRLDPIGRPSQQFLNQYALDRYTFGLEKTLFEGESSIAVLIPFANQFNFQSTFEPPIGFPINPPAVGRSTVNGGSFGNVSLLYKHLLYADDGFAFSGGLGVELPTGTDATANSGFNVYTLQNNATHLHPFLAFLRNSEDDGFFLNGFGQLDFATGTNRLTSVDPLGFTSPAGVPFTVGSYTPQTLLHLSLGGGYWLFRNDGADFFSGMAGLLELHYLSTLDSASTAQYGDPTLPRNLPSISLTQPLNRYDVLNLTTGLHLQLDSRSTLRIGVAVPLQNERLFDAELLVQFNRQL